jgi:hypothetical protein
MRYSPLVVGLVFGCKATPPPITGKWHGTSQITATYSTTLSPKPRSQTIQTDFVLTLTQNGRTVQGDVGVTSFKSPPYHVPIRAGVVEEDGKLTLEGDADSMLNKTHFSLDGKAEAGKLTGTATFGFDNISGTADSKGSITFVPAT